MIWRLVFVHKKLENEGFIEEGNFRCWSNSENHRVFHLSTFNKALQNGFEVRNCPKKKPQFNLCVHILSAQEKSYVLCWCCILLAPFASNWREM